LELAPVIKFYLPKQRIALRIVKEPLLVFFHL